MKRISEKRNIQEDVWRYMCILFDSDDFCIRECVCVCACASVCVGVRVRVRVFQLFICPKRINRFSSSKAYCLRLAGK